MEVKNKKKILTFPSGFLWGAATSSHQTEGDNHNNWTKWEEANAERLAKEAGKKWALWQQKNFPKMLEKENYISGEASNHYNRYESDFNMAKELGMNAQRISIEWSRIEPEEGKFNEKEIEHYRNVIKTIKDRGMEPFVTLWHWTLPLWLSKIGGVSNQKFSDYFSRYAQYLAKELKNEVRFWITINEPSIFIGSSYAKGNWPPQKKNPFIALKVYKILARTHKIVYEKLKKIDTNFQIGFSKDLAYIEPATKYCPSALIAVWLSNYFFNNKFLKLTEGYNDFLAVQYYFHKKLGFFGIEKNDNLSVTDVGWEIYPEGIYHVLANLKKYNLPIYITENGLADAKDEKRERFIKDHLFWVHKAIQEGADVRGYFYWSLLDNFEWDKGFWPRFGLIEVDFKTQVRTIRHSAYEYAKICKNNALEITSPSG